MQKNNGVVESTWITKWDVGFHLDSASLRDMFMLPLSKLIVEYEEGFCYDFGANLSLWEPLRILKARASTRPPWAAEKIY